MFRRLGLLVVIVLAAIVAGTIVPRPLISPATPAGPESTLPILVISNPIHTDVAIPLTTDMRSAFAFLETFGLPISAPDAQWLVFGWGGRAFYLETPTWSELKPLPVLKAITIDRSVLRVDVWGSVDLAHPAVSAFRIDTRDAEPLVDFILASFVRDGEAVLPVVDAGFGISDRFFEAHGSFNVLVGCNTWTAKALRAAGLRTGLWNPLPQTLVLSLELFNRAAVASGHAAAFQ